MSSSLYHGTLYLHILCNVNMKRVRVCREAGLSRMEPSWQYCYWWARHGYAAVFEESGDGRAEVLGRIEEKWGSLDIVDVQFRGSSQPSATI